MPSSLDVPLPDGLGDEDYLKTVAEVRGICAGWHAHVYITVCYSSFHTFHRFLLLLPSSQMQQCALSDTSIVSTSRVLSPKSGRQLLLLLLLLLAQVLPDVLSSAACTVRC